MIKGWSKTLELATGQILELSKPQGPTAATGGVLLKAKNKNGMAVTLLLTAEERKSLKEEL